MGDLVTRKMVDLDGGPIPKGRVSKRLEKAIRLIEENGYTVADAAQSVDLRTHSLTQALRKPHVRAFRADVKRAWRQSEAPKAWNRIASLAAGAQSEKVMLEANRTILTALGELNEETGEAAPSTLINITQNVVNMGQPLTQRLPGVMQDDDYVDVPFEPLDQNGGLTPQDDG